MNQALNDFVALKLSYLESIQSIGMTWWASSVVFCGSIIAAVWIKRHDLAGNQLLPSLRTAAAVFFLSIVTFGSFMVYHCLALAAEIRARDVRPEYFEKEFLATAVGYGIATTSFILITIAWFALTRHIRFLVTGVALPNAPLIDDASS